MKRLPLLAAAALAALLAGTAQAQLSTGGDGPLAISGDRTEVQPNECVTIWSGRVEATQGQTRIRADRVTTRGSRSSGSSCSGEFERIEASGNVYYVTPEIKARGDQAVYTVGNETITVTGKVVVSSDQGVTETNRLVLNVRTGQATMGDAAPGQRVRAVIYPSKK